MLGRGLLEVVWALVVLWWPRPGLCPLLCAQPWAGIRTGRLPAASPALASPTSSPLAQTRYISSGWPGAGADGPVPWAPPATSAEGLPGTAARVKGHRVPRTSPVSSGSPRPCTREPPDPCHVGPAGCGSAFGVLGAGSGGGNSPVWDSGASRPCRGDTSPTVGRVSALLPASLRPPPRVSPARPAVWPWPCGPGGSGWVAPGTPFPL